MQELRTTGLGPMQDPQTERETVPDTRADIGDPVIMAAAITAADATAAVIDRRRLRHRTRRTKVYVMAECGNDVRIAAAFPALSERLTMYLDAVLLRRDGGLLRRSGV